VTSTSELDLAGALLRLLRLVLPKRTLGLLLRSNWKNHAFFLIFILVSALLPILFIADFRKYDKRKAAG